MHREAVTTGLRVGAQSGPRSTSSGWRTRLTSARRAPATRRSSIASTTSPRSCWTRRRNTRWTSTTAPGCVDRCGGGRRPMPCATTSPPGAPSISRDLLFPIPAASHRPSPSLERTLTSDRGHFRGARHNQYHPQRDDRWRLVVSTSMEPKKFEMQGKSSVAAWRIGSPEISKPRYKPGSRQASTTRATCLSWSTASEDGPRSSWRHRVASATSRPHPDWQ
jgi:hypothetical protein